MRMVGICKVLPLILASIGATNTLLPDTIVPKIHENALRITSYIHSPKVKESEDSYWIVNIVLGLPPDVDTSSGGKLLVLFNDGDGRMQQPGMDSPRIADTQYLSSINQPIHVVLEDQRDYMFTLELTDKCTMCVNIYNSVVYRLHSDVSDTLTVKINPRMHICKAYYFNVARQYKDAIDEIMIIIRAMNREGFTIDSNIRTIYSHAHKGLLKMQKTNWDLLQNERKKLVEQVPDPDLSLIDDVIHDIEMRCLSYYQNVTETIDECIMPELLCQEESTENAINIAYFLKMKGDYARYILEMCNEEERAAVVDAALKAYREALQIASRLPVTHYTRVGIYMNFAVFQYMALEDSEAALKLIEEVCKAISTDNAMSSSFHRNKDIFNQIIDLYRKIKYIHSSQPL